MLSDDSIPHPVADDAPSPGEVGDEVRTPGTATFDVVAVDHDGGRYCMECANPEYVDLCKGDPRQIPYGGPVDRGSEVDCPGSACDNCHRRIVDMTVLHYGDVCDPFSCPDMASQWHPADAGARPVDVAVLGRDGGQCHIMLKNDEGKYGVAGDDYWVSESEVWQSDE